MSRMGDEIARLRKEIGITPKQLAKTVGVSEGFINDVEWGRKIPSDDQINRISKALRKEVGRLDIYETEEKNKAPEPDSAVVKVIEKPVQQIWNDALAGILVNVPVYNGKMDKVMGDRKLPIIANKVEGFPKEKVLYIHIDDETLADFRISKGDHVLAVSTHEVEKEALYLIEYHARRAIKKIKMLKDNKLLLISSKGSLATETVSQKDIKVIARLIRLEVLL